MITQEIKLHQEPEPYKWEPVKSNLVPAGKFFKTTFTVAEIDAERVRALTHSIKHGSKWSYPHSNVWIQVTGFKFNPNEVEAVNGSPCIIKAVRKSMLDTKEFEFNYSVDEILEMEPKDD